jgi:hypothetical protein
MSRANIALESAPKQTSHRPDASAKQVLSQQASQEDKEHNIDQMKAPHRLQAEQVSEVGIAGQHEPGRRGYETQADHRLGQTRESRQY